MVLQAFIVLLSILNPSLETWEWENIHCHSRFQFVCFDGLHLHNLNPLNRSNFGFASKTTTKIYSYKDVRNLTIILRKIQAKSDHKPDMKFKYLIILVYFWLQPEKHMFFVSLTIENLQKHLPFDSSMIMFHT